MASFFSEKLVSIMQKPGQDPMPKDDVPWYFKYGGRLLGTLGGFFCIFVGAWNIASILLVQVASFISGVLMVILGFTVICIEAPCCCLFIEYVQKLSDFVDSRPYWQRAAAYCGLSVVPLLVNFGLGSLFACGLVFGTGAIYGLMSIGKKGSGLDGLPQSGVGSPQQGVPPATDHHVTLMEDPDVWRPT